MKKIDLKHLDKSTWEPYKFQEIAQKISKTVKPEEAKVDIYVGLEHLDGEDIHIRRKGSPSDVKGGKLRCYPGDIIFGKRRAYQRKAAILDFEGICSAHAFVFRANPDVIDPKLFPFFLHSDEFMHRMVDISVGGLSPTINWGDLKNQEFLLPPKDQQAKLAELLWAMDAVIEGAKTLLFKLEDTYISLIEKKLINREDDKLYFGNILKVIRGVGYKPYQLLEEYNNDNCIVLRSNNINNNELNYDDIKILPKTIIKKSQILQEGDFAICMSNGSKELVGKCAEYYYNNKNVSIGSFCAGLRPKNESARQLIRHLVNSESYRVAIKRILTGSAINNLKPSDIEELFLRVDLKEKDRILTKLDELLVTKDKINSSVLASETMLKSLINRIF